MLVYVNFPNISNVKTQWKVLGLSLSLEEQIWCIYSSLLDLSTVQ